MPAYDQVHSELNKVGVTLKLLWKEYKAECQANGSIPVGYSKYCEDYGKYLDVDTGEIVTVYLFVATLPYNQYSYVEPCLDMKQNTWLRCHINMYQFFDGVPVRTVCDNLKIGVIKHPKEGEIILNSAYEELGNHYCTAIMPTGVRKPKQKASVEGTVGKIATAIIAKLRNEEFHSLGELKIAIRQALTAFNEAPFKRERAAVIWFI